MNRWATLLKKQWWIILMAELAIMYLLAVGMLYGFQRRLIFQPDSRPPDLAAAKLNGQLDSLQEVKILTSDALNLLAWYHPAATGKPVVLMFHGNAGNLQYRTFKIQPLIKAGYGVLLPAWRGYSGNAGAPSQQGLFADADAAMAWLVGQGITPDRTVLYGESLGTAMAIRGAANNPQIKAVILEAPFTSMVALTAYHMPIIPKPLAKILVKDPFDSLGQIGQVKAPLLLLHGWLDYTVPIGHGQALLAAATAPKRLIDYRHAGHNDLYDFGAGHDILAFLSNPVVEAMHDQQPLPASQP